MKKTILSLLIGSFLFASCKKDLQETLPQPAPVNSALPCIQLTANPAGLSYPADALVGFECVGNFCSMLPLNTNNYWIYQDSIFNDGVLTSVSYDTLRFDNTFKTSDGLIWWSANMYIGLPDLFYVNESAFFSNQARMWDPSMMDVKKDYCLFTGDSLRYLASFEDAAAIGRSLRLYKNSVNTLAGSFDDCIYFEKNARNYRRDQVFFKPGIGVLKYIQEKAPMGSPAILLQQVSTLVKFHLE